MESTTPWCRNYAKDMLGRARSKPRLGQQAASCASSEPLVRCCACLSRHEQGTKQHCNSACVFYTVQSSLPSPRNDMKSRGLRRLYACTGYTKCSSRSHLQGHSGDKFCDQLKHGNSCPYHQCFFVRIPCNIFFAPKCASMLTEISCFSFELYIMQESLAIFNFYSNCSCVVFRFFECSAMAHMEAQQVPWGR